MELTDTNRSIDLIVPITNVHLYIAMRFETFWQLMKKVSLKNQFLEKLLRFADLVVIAERLHPIPFRTRP